MSIPSDCRRVEYLESTKDNNFPYIFLPNLGTINSSSGKKDPPSKGEYKIKMRRYDGGEIRIIGFGDDTYTSESEYTVSRNCCNVIGGSADVKTYITSVNYGCNWKNLTPEDLKVKIDPIGTDLEIDYIFEPGKQVLTVNGVSITLNCTFNPYSNGYKGFYLFRVNHAMKDNNRMFGSTRIYYAKVYEDGELKADLVPVANGTTGYMFDYVTNQLYSAVTGSFIVGSDICKFKDPSNKLLCKVIHGYCQFQKDEYQDGHDCSIKENYKNLDI